tara:strand:+ start:16317 stop:20528 length:4212 start_codon:yes stop_codon:yes gene_type:complete
MSSVSKYSCKRCGKNFSQKSHFDSHMNRKNPCENVLQKMQEYSEKIKELENNTNSYVNSNNLKTMKKLHESLYNFQGNIFEFMNMFSDEDKMKCRIHEALFIIFGSLGLIEKLQEFTPCTGNFNLRDIAPMKNIYKDLYFNNGEERSICAGSDSSDFTLINKHNSNHYIACSAKYYKNENIGELDIEKIHFYAKKYNEDNNKVDTYLLVPNRKITTEKINRANKTSELLKEAARDCEILDWNDLNDALKNMRNNKITPSSVKNWDENNEKIIVNQRLHGDYVINQTIHFLKEENAKHIVWYVGMRLGKSYMAAGLFHEYNLILNKPKVNYLFITSIPNETTKDRNKWMHVFENNLNLSEFEIITLDGEYNKNNPKPKLKNKNIIFCSVQFLKNKENEEKINTILWLKNIHFDLRITDETHFGLSTSMSKKVLTTYGNNAPTIHTTGTADKVIKFYNIKKNHCIYWTTQDNKFCQQISDEEKRNELIKRKGPIFENILKNYSYRTIEELYNSFPELITFTHDIKKEKKSKIIEKTKNKADGYGWSIEGLQLLVQYHSDNTIEKRAEFQNPQAVCDMWYSIFGKYDEDSILDSDYENCFMERYKNTCQTLNSRTIGNTEEPMIILVFLSNNNIHKTSLAHKELLEKHNIVNNKIHNYLIICTNTIVSNEGIKKRISDATRECKMKKKKGIIVLTGKQGHLGITLPSCDIVILLDNSSKNSDSYHQKKNRCLSDAENKKAGFVFDLNIHRCIKEMISYGNSIGIKGHPTEVIKYLLKNRIICFNIDQWDAKFGEDLLEEYSDDIYEYYSTNNFYDTLHNTFDSIEIKESDFVNGTFVLFNSIFKNVKILKNKKKMITIKQEQEQENINNGIIKGGKKTYLLNNNEDSSDKVSSVEEQSVINPFDILIPITVIHIILTIRMKNVSTLKEMNLEVRKNEELTMILNNQVRLYWGNKITNEQVEMVINILIDYLENDNETSNLIHYIKELFYKNLKDKNEFSKIIDKYFTPQELERKNNAEISTPYFLRADMINKIPEETWKLENVKVLEPCCGKGAFVLDIINKLMFHMRDKIKNEEKRYEEIVTKHLYFADINPLNIHICKLLIDPEEKYNLNCYIGDTLQLNINEKWNINGFDIIINNPPYQDPKGSSNGTLWDKFVKYGIDNLNTNGVLCYVHPSGWRNVDGKFKYLQKEIFNNNLKYLEIHNESDGLKTFNAETRYDWYILEKSNNYDKTTILFEDNKEMIIDVRKLDIIPNGDFELFQELLGNSEDELCEVMHSYSFYDPRKEWMSEYESETHIHPCVYTITHDCEVKKKYTSKNLGHIGVPKLMWSNGRIKSIGSVIDYDGKYGLTCFAYAIVDDKEHLENIKKAFDSYKFRRFMEYCAVGQLTVNFKAIALFKKDFWKHFI